MSINVRNLKNGETIIYSLPIIAGDVQPALSQGSVTVLNLKSGSSNTWPVYNGLFKVLVQLEPGENKIELRYFDEKFIFVLFYIVPKFLYFVRPIYIKCCDDSGKFQGPDDEDCSMESALSRICFAAKLLQSFTAEKLFEHDFERKTFLLENDLHPSRPACSVFTSKLTLKEAHGMSGSDLWMTFARELMSSKQFKDKMLCKWFVFMSFTRYLPPPEQIPKSHSDVLRFTKGHTALGGGGLALYGSGTLHCWAQNLDELLTRLTDNRKMDRTRLMDDSAYREFYWANYSTGLGAALHELGHTFDLAHTPTGIMARGFDDIHRVFTVFPHRGNGDVSGHCSSPIPYSPRQSPVRKTLEPPAINGSPKPCCHPNRLRPQSWSDTPPKVIQVETSFKKLNVQTSQTMIVKNYDGSEVVKTITRHKDGMETVVDLTTCTDSKQILKECIKNTTTGKLRTTLSMTMYKHSSDETISCSHLPSQANQSGNICLSSRGSSHRNGSVDSSPPSSVVRFQEVRYKDGGAHWYRSSAVLLRYHKWFNFSSAEDCNNQPSMDGPIIRCPCGVRLIELRTVPDGAVFHHWEFVYTLNPPTQFTLSYSEVSEMMPAGEDIGLLAMDHEGNVFKKRITICDLRSSTSSSNGDV